MDFSNLVKAVDGGGITDQIFAKRDIVSEKQSRRQRKAKLAAGGDNATADEQSVAAAGAGKKKGEIADADGRKKKHLSHKKDPISRDETRRTVFVGNLLNTVSHQQVAKFFEGLPGCGEVEAARLRCVRLAPLAEGQKNRGRGVRILRGEIEASEDATATAYVVFKTIAGAEAAVKHTASVFRGRHLSVTSEAPEAKAFAPRSSVYLGNLPYSVTDEAIWGFFVDHGMPDVTRVRIVRDQQTGKAKGFGYVEFATRESVVKSLKLRQPMLQGRTVRIFSVQKSRDPTVQNVSRRDKRAASAVEAATAAAPATKKKAGGAVASAAADAATKKDKKKQGGGTDDDASAAAVAPVKEAERPSWMGVTADPRKKLSKELRWLTQDPTSRKAAAKSRHKDRVRANFVKKKKEAKAAQ